MIHPFNSIFIPIILSPSSKTTTVNYSEKNSNKTKKSEKKMSSWIPSLFNPFSDDDNPTSPAPSPPNETASRSPTSGVKDDLSAVFRGVAAFLAPQQQSASSSEKIEGIKHDLAEIQGSFRSGLSLISSKIASNLVQLQSQLNDDNDEVGEDEEEEEDAVGINEEVLDFVRRISGRPELWTDFPLSLLDDFDLSDYQEEHASSIDDFIPEFVTLRQKICSQMSHGKFWFIYFILLLPRLNEDDFKLLVTPQVAEARETLLKKLQNKTEADQENPEPSDTNKESTGKKNGTELGGESPSQHKDVSPITLNPNEQREDVSETESGPHFDQKQSENEEEVSFSDLEDDDDNNENSDKPLSSSKASTSDKANSVKLNENSRERESEDEESNDWLTVDDTDFDNLAAV